MVNFHFPPSSTFPTEVDRNSSRRRSKRVGSQGLIDQRQQSPHHQQGLKCSLQSYSSLWPAQMSLESLLKCMCMDLFVVCAEDILPAVVLSSEKNFQWQFSLAGKKNSMLLITPSPPTKRLHDKPSAKAHREVGKLLSGCLALPPLPQPLPCYTRTGRDDWACTPCARQTPFATARAQVLTSLLTSIAAFTNTTDVHQVRGSLE